MQVSWVDSATLTCIAPFSTLVGQVNVTVTNPDSLTGGLNNGYSYTGIVGSAPQISSSVANTTCAVVNGGAQCWGGNTFGQLGNGSLLSSITPVSVNGLGNGSGVQGISTGSQATCAIVNGGVQCWGANSLGQLGNNSTLQSGVPVQVSGLVAGVETLSVGGDSACAVVNGSAQCWGGNGSGELGSNSTSLRSLIPVQVSSMTAGVQTISVGQSSACAVMNGGAWCWGQNDRGQLGNNSNTNSLIPVAVFGLSSGVQAISVGYKTACAVVNGSAHCWGAGSNGALGNSLAIDSSIPVQVSGLTSGVQGISAANHPNAGFSCAVVRGSAQCWGSGLIGSSNTLSYSTPTPVVGLGSGVQAITTGGLVGCSIVNGGAQCWGSAGLGNNGITSSTIPVQVFGLSTL